MSKLTTEKASGFLKLIRPVNCVMMGFAVIVGAFVVRADISSHIDDVLLKFALGFSTAFTLTGASMAINDYWDRDIDKVNEPTRPIPSGLVSPIEALIFAAILTILGIIAATLTNSSCLVIAAIAWLVSVIYTTKGKGTGLPGNLLVSLCIAIPFIYGSFIIKETVELSPVLFASLAFLSNTGRELTKGIVDVQGDRTKNIKTIAISHGERKAAFAAAIFYVLASGLSLLPLYLGLVSPFVVLADAGFVGSSLLLVHDHSLKNARRIKNLVLLWMGFGLLAFITGSIAR